MGGGIVQPQPLQQGANAQADAAAQPQPQQLAQDPEASVAASAHLDDSTQVTSDLVPTAMDTASEVPSMSQAQEAEPDSSQMSTSQDASQQQHHVESNTQDSVDSAIQATPSSSASDAQASAPTGHHDEVTVHATPYVEFQDVNAHDAKSIHCVLTLEASAHEPDDRTPIDVVCVIDVSGSMQGTKLENAKRTLDFVIKQLRPADRMALVTYDSNVSTVFGLTTMRGDHKEKCRDACKKLEAGSCTNLSGGLLQGIQILRDLGQQGQDRRAVSSVLLMTDGIANEGITGTKEIVAAMRAAKESLPTTTVYTFGYGADHNTDLLKNISEAGSGMYYYIENVDLIPQCFADCLGGLLSTVAQNISITITAAPEHSIKKIHSQRPFTLNADGKSAVVQMGDIQSEETRDLLFEVNVPAIAQPHGAEAIVQAEVSFLNVVHGKFETKASQFGLARSESAGPQEKVVKVEQQKSRIRTADAIENARMLAERRDFANAQGALNAVLTELESSADPFAKELVADLRQCAATVSSREQYQYGGSQMMSNMCQTHQYQRSNQPQSAARNFVSYTTSVKTRFREAAM